LADIWSAYLRGQIILGVVIGILVSVTLALLRVQNALALGLAFRPAGVYPGHRACDWHGAAVLVALFQPTHVAGLSPLAHAGVVLAAMIVIQQLENNILVPRIVGSALDLHPILVMVGVFMGASIAGILGAVLAAPVLASVKLVGVYAWRKMFDLPPFPPSWFADTGADPLPRGLRGMWMRLRGPAQVLRERLTDGAGTAPPSGTTPDEPAGD
jgi:putative heme transporter